MGLRTIGPQGPCECQVVGETHLVRGVSGRYDTNLEDLSFG